MVHKVWVRWNSVGIVDDLTFVIHFVRERSTHALEHPKVGVEKLGPGLFVFIFAA